LSPTRIPVAAATNSIVDKGLIEFTNVMIAETTNNGEVNYVCYIMVHGRSTYAVRPFLKSINGESEEGSQFNKHARMFQKLQEPVVGSLPARWVNNFKLKKAVAKYPNATVMQHVVKEKRIE